MKALYKEIENINQSGIPFFVTEDNSVGKVNEFELSVICHEQISNDEIATCIFNCLPPFYKSLGCNSGVANDAFGRSYRCEFNRYYIKKQPQ